MILGPKQNKLTPHSPPPSLTINAQTLLAPSPDRARSASVPSQLQHHIILLLTQASRKETRAFCERCGLSHPSLSYHSVIKQTQKHMAITVQNISFSIRNQGSNLSLKWKLIRSELPDYRALSTCFFCEQNIPDAIESTLQPFTSLMSQIFI